MYRTAWPSSAQSSCRNVRDSAAALNSPGEASGPIWCTTRGTIMQYGTVQESVVQYSTTAKRISSKRGHNIAMKLNLRLEHRNICENFWVWGALSVSVFVFGVMQVWLGAPICRVITDASVSCLSHSSLSIFSDRARLRALPNVSSNNVCDSLG